MEDKWIRVEDGLPHKYTRVLVTDGAEVHEAYRDSRTGEWRGWTCLSNEYLDTITHYIALPAPPTEDK